MNKTFEKYINLRYDHLLRMAKKSLKTKKELSGDLLHDVIDYMDDKLNYNLEWAQFTANTEYFLGYVIHTQANSVTSPFYKKYIAKGKLYYQNNFEITYIQPQQEQNDEQFYSIQQENYNEVMSILNTEYPPDSGEVLLFKLYYLNKYSYRKIEDLTGIPYTTVWKAVKRVRNKIKEKI